MLQLRFDGGEFAVPLQIAELGRVLFHRTADAVFVSCQEIKLAGVVHPGAALGEGGVEFGLIGILGDMFALAEREDGVFQGTGAVEAPAVLGDGLGEIDFESAFGGEGLADSVAVLVEGFLVFRSVDDDLAGESVAEGVEGRTLFTFRGPRTRRKLGVFTAGGKLCFCHFGVSFMETIPAKKATPSGFAAQVAEAVGEIGRVWV